MEKLEDPISFKIVINLLKRTYFYTYKKSVRYKEEGTGIYCYQSTISIKKSEHLRSDFFIFYFS